MRTGDPDRARGHLKLATVMRPDSETYRDALALVSRVTVVVLDLDGVLWRGDEPIPGSAAAVQALRDGGAGSRSSPTTRATGSPTTWRSSPRLGIAAAPDDVLTSAQAAAELLARDARARRRGAGVRRPGRRRGARAGGLPGRRPRGRRTRWSSASTGTSTSTGSTGPSAQCATARGFVATNTDPTYPGADHVLPGRGVDRGRDRRPRRDGAPEVAGKPEPATAALVRRRLGDDGIMVGDRPSTDGAMADGARLAVRARALRHRRARPDRAGADAAAGVRGRRSGDARAALLGARRRDRSVRPGGTRPSR